MTELTEDASGLPSRSLSAQQASDDAADLKPCAAPAPDEMAQRDQRLE